MLENLIITYKQLIIIATAVGLIITFLKLALTYWKHYVILMRIINWIKFSLACISFLIIILIIKLNSRLSLIWIIENNIPETIIPIFLLEKLFGIKFE